MTVNPVMPVSVIISASANPVCAGTSVTFTASPINPGSYPLYEWFINNFSIGSNVNSWTYSPADGDCIRCSLNSSLVCSSGNPAMSDTVCMTVNPILPVSVTISASANPVCAGTPVTFTATPINSGTNPIYQWFVNDVATGSNSNSLIFTPTDGDCIWCSVNSSLSCSSGNPAMSGLICMTVNPILPISVTISLSANQICTGTPVTFTANPINPGSYPVYQWFVNNAITGSNNSSLTYTPSDGDFIRCSLNSSHVCSSGNPAMSDPVYMTVYPILPVSVTISATANPVCAGKPVTFNATPVNTGTNPIYQWFVNNVATGSNNSSLTFSPSDGDCVRCSMNSSLSCSIGNPAMSGTICMTVNPVPVIILVPCFDTITTITSQPIRLRSDLPLGGYYSGPGVDSATGTFSPEIAGIGSHTIFYRYSNIYSCLSQKAKTIHVQQAIPFTCGNMLRDIRDQKLYETVLIGSRCWMSSNLNFGHLIEEHNPQTDNCIAERYAWVEPGRAGTALYQWDELMNYLSPEGSQGLCPPGWHVPTMTEWIELADLFFGPGQAGAYMKCSFPASVFRSIQSGIYYLNSTWAFTAGNYPGTMYWTSTSIGLERAVARGLNDQTMSVSRYYAPRNDAFPVRCVKDDN